MQVVRLFSGDDGESHFEELELPYEDVARAQATAMRSVSASPRNRLLSHPIAT